MLRFIPLCIVALVGCSDADKPVPKPADGIYAIREDGEGLEVLKTNGQKLRLGPRRGVMPAERAIVSEANDNSRFILSLTNVQPLTSTPGMGYITLVVDGVAMTSHGQSQAADGTSALSFKFEGLEWAKKFAARLNCPLQIRTNPGRLLEATWRTDKDEYRVGEPITVTLELRNVSAKTVSFQNGGKQRGKRNNQFRFLAYRSGGHGTAVPDTGDPTHFGGIGGPLPLKPGESLKNSVKLDGWFQFTEPGVYRITGIFELQFSDPADAAVFNVPIWDDLATGDFFVRVLADKQ